MRTSLEMVKQMFAEHVPVGIFGTAGQRCSRPWPCLVIIEMRDSSPCPR
ncbi:MULTISPECIES: hypothetical protein [Nocardia]|nr:MULTISPECIES: hypothetical protein [Nocardia]